MTNAYSPLANGGKQIEPIFIRSVTDTNGTLVYEQKPPVRQVLHEDTAYVLTHMMQGVFEPALNSYTSVTGGSVAKQLTHPTAGKSGSTPRDSWMVGYTPQLVIGVWTGYDKDKEINQTESQVAKRIWADLMEFSMKDELKLPFKKPAGVEYATIDPHTGLLANDACPGGRQTAFLQGTAPINPVLLLKLQKNYKKNRKKRKMAFLNDSSNGLVLKTAIQVSRMCWKKTKSLN